MHLVCIFYIQNKHHIDSIIALKKCNFVFLSGVYYIMINFEANKKQIMLFSALFLDMWNYIKKELYLD